MWTQVYINHDAIPRIRKNPEEFAQRLFDALVDQAPVDRTAICVAGFVPAVVVGRSTVELPGDANGSAEASSD
jgi:hypothetical protein